MVFLKLFLVFLVNDKQIQINKCLKFNRDVHMFEVELNSYWKKVVDTIKDGIMIVDKGGTIVSVNKALEKITGYSSDAFISDQKLWLRIIHPNDSHICLFYHIY